MKGALTTNPPHLLNPGEYCFWEGRWCARTPNGLLANLAQHNVVISEDGTVTVSPSILTTGAEGKTWHGFLEKDVWREC